MNDAKEVIGYIAPSGDDLNIGCSASKNLVINPDQGHITHYCENTYFGDNYGPGRITLTNNGVDSGSITLNNEVQNHSYTDVDHTRLNDVTSDIACVQNQLNRTNTNVSAVSANNVTTQTQLDSVAGGLNAAEIFIAGHTDDIADLASLINTNANNITNNDSDIVGISSDIAAVDTRVDNVGTAASNQTQVDSIQITVDAHVADISDHTTDITNINAEIDAIDLVLAN